MKIQVEKRRVKSDFVDRYGLLIGLSVMIAFAAFCLSLFIYGNSNRHASNFQTSGNKLTSPSRKQNSEIKLSSGTLKNFCLTSELIGKWRWVAPSQETVKLYQSTGFKQMLPLLWANKGTQITLTKDECIVKKSNEQKGRRYKCYIIKRRPGQDSLVVLQSLTGKSESYRLKFLENSTKLQLTRFFGEDGLRQNSQQVRIEGIFRKAH